MTLGDPRRLTGGYLYHLRMAAAAQRHRARIVFRSFPARPFPLPALAAGRVLGRAGVHAVLLDSIAAAFAGPWWAVRAPEVPVIGVLHQPPGGIDHARMRSLVQAGMDRLAYRHARLLIVASDLLADQLEALGFERERIRVVPPGRDVAVAGGGELGDLRRGREAARGGESSDLREGREAAGGRERSDPRAAREAAAGREPSDLREGREAAAGREPSDLREGREAAFLCVANWIERKGILELLDAFARLRRELATLHLVGDEDAAPAYAAQVRARLAHPDLAGRVVTHGPLSREEVAGLYASADAFALPAFREPYGTVWGEAMAFGLPVVGWRAGNLPYLADDDREALLVPPGDVDGLSRALHRLATDPPSRRRLGEAARARASTRPTWEESAALFFDAIREALGGR